MAANILIVDDSATMRMVVRRTIEMIGLDVGEVYQASNGIEALAQLGDHDIAVLIVDINMPKMNGVQLLERIKGNDRLKHLPIVIASTEGSQQRLDQLAALGYSGFVRKPFQPEQLRDVLTPLLGVVENAGTAGTADSDTDDGFF